MDCNFNYKNDRIAWIYQGMKADSIEKVKLHIYMWKCLAMAARVILIPHVRNTLSRKNIDEECPFTSMMDMWHVVLLQGSVLC